MPLTSSELLTRAALWAYRANEYLLLHVLDDPAWLALMFC
jgi:hypothetical protein